MLIHHASCLYAYLFVCGYTHLLHLAMEYLVSLFLLVRLFISCCMLSVGCFVLLTFCIWHRSTR
ncbi:hypothetical protein SLEP1_g22264 [Rubroshorea leprosula]|uniref:Uncharacterized protein n=1 Tax=Rubroshorea leprosula TaxID=152421 RepID=A0AAV5JE05_9ROSI|nr:hypothetical protein SLEP1_g22264 [Rubroshorea leprosula]